MSRCDRLGSSWISSQSSIYTMLLPDRSRVWSNFKPASPSTLERRFYERLSVTRPDKPLRFWIDLMAFY